MISLCLVGALWSVELWRSLALQASPQFTGSWKDHNYQSNGIGRGLEAAGNKEVYPSNPFRPSIPCTSKHLSQFTATKHPNMKETYTSHPLCHESEIKSDTEEENTCECKIIETSEGKDEEDWRGKDETEMENYGKRVVVLPHLVVKGNYCS